MDRTRDFKVGDRVIGTKAFDNNDDIVGLTGTIVGLSESYAFVEYDEPISNGHTCSGRARQGYGWNTGYEYFELYHEPVLTITMPYEELHI